MPKMSHAGEDHRDAMFVGGGDDFVVFDRAAGVTPTALFLFSAFA